MTKRDLKTGTLYKLKVTNLAFANLSYETLVDFYRDGRTSGRIVEPLIESIFNDLKCNLSGNNKYDLRSASGELNEVKTFTKTGCKLIPSNQIGAGRKYNKDKFLERARQMESYIIVDIREFPILKIIAWPAEYIIKNYPDGRNIPESIFNASKVIDIGDL